jgi:hypothetical protein
VEANLDPFPPSAKTGRVCTFRDVTPAATPSVGSVPGVAHAPDFTLTDQAGHDVTLSEHLDAGVLLVFLRGDW